VKLNAAERGVEEQMTNATCNDKTTCRPAATEQTRSGARYVPNVDILETPEKYVMRADIPGARAESVAVDYERGTLTIHAPVEPRKHDGGRLLLREYGVGDFHRAFQIGEGIDPTGIQAEYNNGVLTLHLPKSAAAKVRKIEVKSM
jgi:HSP20 family protein